MIKSLLVFAHLLAFAFAFAPIARSDWMLWQSRRSPLTSAQLQQLAGTARDASVALILLWISGISLVAMGYANEGGVYLMNEKLWCKGLIVFVMTINGFALHSKVFPLLQKGIAFCDLEKRQRNVAVVLGAVSGSSWVFAAYLGVARFLNETATFREVFTAYLLAVTAASCVALLTQGQSRRVPEASFPAAEEHLGVR